jgi:hypothetical protein
MGTAGSEDSTVNTIPVAYTAVMLRAIETLKVTVAVACHGDPSKSQRRK